MRWFIFILIYFIIDFYAFQAIRAVTKSNTLSVLYFLISVGVVVNFIYQFLQPSDGSVLSGAAGYAFGFLLALIVSKLVLILFLFGEDITRVLVAGFQKANAKNSPFVVHSRRKFLSQIALGVAAIPFLSLLYGMYQGKYNYRVLRYKLYFNDLPEEFDSYTLGQISDIHSGSFDNHKKIKYGVELFNKQKTDLVLFTGDLVNNMAKEMDSWKALFSTISAKDGVYSVLGNHDYGDYKEWESEAAKKANLELLKATHKQMGWDLLLNENRVIERNGQKLHIVGVENWGSGHFKKKGDLNKAGKGLKATDFKILMSHDPSHWNEKVKNDPANYQLTLSGHTHGMQFGIEIPGMVKWSPIQYRYKYWAGVYEEMGRYINVNRGFGYLAYPGRVGIWPELSVIELKKGPKPA